MTNILKRRQTDETRILNNEKGVSLLELLVSIVVGSIVTIILMQILIMTVGAKAQLDKENQMLTGSYIIAEEIRGNIFKLKPQKLEVISDTATSTIIHITHEYDITTDVNNIIIRDYSNPVTDILILDKVNEVITYNGIQLNDVQISITAGSSLDLISIEPAVCDLAVTSCDQGIIQLTMSLSIVLKNGTVLDPQTFVTTILV